MAKLVVHSFAMSIDRMINGFNLAPEVIPQCSNATGKGYIKDNYPYS